MNALWTVVILLGCIPAVTCAAVLGYINKLGLGADVAKIVCMQTLQATVPIAMGAITIVYLFHTYG